MLFAQDENISVLALYNFCCFPFFVGALYYFTHESIPTRAVQDDQNVTRIIESSNLGCFLGIFLYCNNFFLLFALFWGGLSIYEEVCVYRIYFHLTLDFNIINNNNFSVA